MNIIEQNAATKYFKLASFLLCLLLLIGNVNKDDGQNLLNLAKKHLLGNGVPKDYAKAVELLNQAADKGNVEAIADLGAIYYRGTLAPKDLVKAYKLTNIAAARGYSKAIFILAEMYRTGEGVQKNKNKAVSLLLQAISQGDVYALMLIGHMYKDGEVNSLEHSKAAELFRNKTSPNDVSTMYYLGRFYELSGNFHEAAIWFTKANETKNTAINSETVCSMYQLGLFYTDGKGVEKNAYQANRLLTATAASVIRHHDELLMLDFDITKFNSSDLTNAFVQLVSYQKSHHYSKNIEDGAAKMADEITKMCSFP